MIFIFDIISSSETPRSRATMIITNTSTTIDNPKPNGIQRGDVTHHQDQSILFVSFSIKKIINRTPVKLSPDPDSFFMIILIFYFIPNLFNKVSRL